MKDPSPELVAGVLRQDQRACTELIRRYGGLVRAAVHQRGYFFEDARDEEELQSRVHLAIIKSIGTWKRERAFSSWVYGVARNLVNSFLRDVERRVSAGRAGTEISLEIAEEISLSSTMEEDHVIPPRLEAFYGFYDQLSSEKKIVIEHMMSGNKHNELARALNITEDAAKMRVMRMKEEIQKQLRDQF